MATFHLIVHVYERNNAPWTYSCRFMHKVDGSNVRFPIYAFTGTLPFNTADDPRVILRQVLRRIDPA